MKRNFLNIILVIVLAALSVFVGYHISQKTNSAEGETTATKQAVTEKEGKRILLAEDKDRDFRFYGVGSKLVLVHSDREFEYDDVLSAGVNLDKPVLWVLDVNRDGTEELLLQVGETTVNDEVYHSVYGFTYYSTDSSDGYKITAMNESSVSNLFDRLIQVQMTQDESCPKNCLFAMSSVYDAIKFNRETGIPEDNYYYMFKAAQDKDGKYMTLLNWNRDKVECKLPDKKSNRVEIVIPVIISYKETKETHNAGYITFGLYITPDGTLGILGKSMEFVAYKEYGLYKYNFKDGEDKAWKSTVNNSNSTVPRDKVIDFIQYNDIDFTAEVVTDNFARHDGDLNALASITADENCIRLTAKPGCSFSKSLVENSQYSINLYSNSENAVNTFDISYTSSIEEDGDGNEVLRINYDKKYRQRVMKQIAVNFGVK